MAFIRQRQRSDGTVSFTVLWRPGGKRGSKQASEVFDDEQQAKQFANLVDGHGQHWPPGWVRGRGFVTAEEECSADEMFLPFAHQYVDRLTGIQSQTRSNYRKFIDRHMAPWFRELSVRDVTMTLTRDHVSDWVNDLESGRRGPHHDAKETVPSSGLNGCVNVRTSAVD